MTKRKKLVLASLVVLLLATSAFLYFRTTDKPIRINGNLAPEDLAAVQSIVRREIWRSNFRNLSFKPFRNLPGAIKTSLSLRIDSIDVLSDDAWQRKLAEVQVVSGKSSRNAVCTFVCAKSSNQWDVVSRIGPPRYIDSDRIQKLTP
ncbi:hypothetical protein [Pedosphaera parvula]|uniref:Uncharacterized protein n=1 Tax=Pedosphaera parvula (strain Ellin514) TaxID=320771 RepID=B9XED8_PEDPL|nr:hypothetical protein [Pedosphaera parvula]EEF61652.1 hypothetical protein Cflav_PD4692 [Pedosphaera parvula Ellin514]